MSITADDDIEPGGPSSDFARFTEELTRSTAGEPSEDELADGSGLDGRNGSADPETGGRDGAAANDAGPVPSASPGLSAVGFATIIEQMDRRSREAVAMVRLLEQNRQMLEVAETERDGAYAELARTVPTVQETAQRLDTALKAVRGGTPAPDLDGLFKRNSEALAHLERTAFALSAHFARCRTAWEQYVGSVQSAERLRRDGGRGP